jgi:hypothetical protein
VNAVKLQSWLALCSLAWLLLARPPVALAHVGAPYPVLLEEPAGPYRASVLADPDVGAGTLYVLVTLPDETPAPAGTVVTIWTRPDDGHLAEAGYQTVRQDTRYGDRFVARIPFDARGPWQVRLAIEGPSGSGEQAFPLQVTPKGTSWLASLLCLLPAGGLAALWLRAAQRQAPAEEQ